MRKMNLFFQGIFGLVLIGLATPVFGFQGTLTGTPLDNLLRTCATYASGPLVAGGSLIALGTGGVMHAVSHGEHGRNWLIGGAVGLGVAATARFVPPLLGLAF